MGEITAKEIRKIDGWTADARLFKLSEPVPYGWDWDEENTKGLTDYVIISAALVPFSGAETYIFPAKKDGTAIEMLEMPGSFQGGLDHAAAIAGAGWALAA